MYLYVYIICVYDVLDGSWSFSRKLDQQRAPEVAVETSNTAAARNLFKSKTSLGQEKKADSDTLWTQHDNLISGISIANAGPKVTKVSTSGFDGRLVIWQLSDLSLDMAALKL